jgi:serine/threonine protein kinase
LISTYESVDCFILVLEKGNGGSLIEYLKSQPHQYNEKMLKSILKQLLENVAILHEAGFIHRDIKPENIICKDTACPSIFLCDYGISIEKDKKYGVVEDHHIAGTIGYIAPEIVNEEDYDEKCDIFSIGSLFFYLFTGKKLFDSKNIFELRAFNETSEFIDAKLEDLTGLGFEVKDIMENLLRFNQEDRFSAK